MRSSTKESLIERLYTLQPSFLIGTAASAHQVEGGNINDWTIFERDGRVKDGQVSGIATNHYELFEQDFSLLAELGFRGHRLSIAWSRLIPKEGVINQEEVDHYRKVLSSLKGHNLINFVTLHHFTSPQWFIEKGGFKKKKNIIYWEEFVKLVCQELGSMIDVFNTVNEPFVYSTTGYMQGIHSPGEKSLFSYFKVSNNLMRAHFYAVEIIRKLCPDTPVGLVKNIAEFTSKSRNPINKIITWFSDWGFNKTAFNAMKTQKIPFGFRKIKRGDIGDFIGINFYMKMVTGLGLPDLMVPHDLDEERLTQMGWGVHPESMIKEIKRLWRKLDLPIFITENGIATDDDIWRQQYIKDHLFAIIDLLEEGIDIRGYFYWSNIDNFEWEHGFNPKFGLIAFNNETFKRLPKGSAYFLGEIASKSVHFQTMIEF